ncbi:MAG: 5-carboxymethyl-2-hydroxymuconate isomerase [Pseudomonadales bacterium]
MAHFVLEYSTNLSDADFQPRELLAQIVECAVASGVFPRAGCRARAHPCDDYYIADGRADFAFVHLEVRLGAGRSAEEKSQVQTALVELLEAYFRPLTKRQGLAISFEMSELPEHKSNINNIRDYLDEA